MHENHRKLCRLGMCRDLNNVASKSLNRSNTLGEGGKDKKWRNGAETSGALLATRRINKCTPALSHSQRVCPCARKHAKDPTRHTVLWSGYWGIFILQIGKLLPKTCLKFSKMESAGRGTRPGKAEDHSQPASPSHLLPNLKTGMNCMVGTARVEGR